MGGPSPYRACRYTPHMGIRPDLENAACLPADRHGSAYRCRPNGAARARHRSFTKLRKSSIGAVRRPAVEIAHEGRAVIGREHVFCRPIWTSAGRIAGHAGCIRACRGLDQGRGRGHAEKCTRSPGHRRRPHATGSSTSGSSLKSMPISSSTVSHYGRISGISPDPPAPRNRDVRVIRARSHGGHWPAAPRAWPSAPGAARGAMGGGSLVISWHSPCSGALPGTVRLLVRGARAGHCGSRRDHPTGSDCRPRVTTLLRFG